MTELDYPVTPDLYGECDEVSLYFGSHNPTGKSTILLIHGAGVSGLDWDLVLPYLHQYHLIVPDLPSHGRSQNINPLSLEKSSSLLASLIRKHGRNGRAHIVGHSLGAHVTINLASSHPDVVDAIFVSGFEIYPSGALASLFPYAMWTQNRLQDLVPRRLIRWLMDGTDIPRGDPKTCTINLYRQILPIMTATTWPSPWLARTLVVAAGKGGIIPTRDHQHDAVKLMQIGREKNPETTAVTHPEMRHPWNRQDPALFAETAHSWFENEDIPTGFQKL